MTNSQPDDGAAAGLRSHLRLAGRATHSSEGPTSGAPLGCQLRGTDIAQHAIVSPPGVGSPAPDPDDQLLWDLLAAKPDLLLVTGGNALQRDAAMRSRVVSPQAFADAP